MVTRRRHGAGHWCTAQLQGRNGIAAGPRPARSAAATADVAAEHDRGDRAGARAAQGHRRRLGARPRGPGVVDQQDPGARENRRREPGPGRDPWPRVAAWSCRQLRPRRGQVRADEGAQRMRARPAAAGRDHGELGRGTRCRRLARCTGRGRAGTRAVTPAASPPGRPGPPRAAWLTCTATAAGHADCP